jgi:hypothetical protein
MGCSNAISAFPRARAPLVLITPPNFVLPAVIGTITWFVVKRHRPYKWVVSCPPCSSSPSVDRGLSKSPGTRSFVDRVTRYHNILNSTSGETDGNGLSGSGIEIVRSTTHFVQYEMLSVQYEIKKWYSLYYGICL